MNQFIQKYEENITGTLSGWDRIVFRGTLRMLCFVDGMMGYLARVGVLLKDFGEHAQAMTGRLIAASLAAAEEAARPVKYLESAEIRKENVARDIAEGDGIHEGLICVLTCPWIDDFSKAQRLMDRMHAIRWPKVLDRVARRLNPAHGAMFRGLELSYYWSAYQTEWATDITFESSRTLAAIYPQLVRGAIASFVSRDVMRFLGKRPDRRYQGEVVSDYVDRPEGVRVKHVPFGNSLKVYDKGGSILRIETTINQPGTFRSYRVSENEPDGGKSWRPMRKGVADLHRRAEVSQQCNDRYSDALASLDTTTPLGTLAATVCRRVTKDGKRYRALRPWSDEDQKLLEILSDGTFAVNGFSNRDLACRLYRSASADPAQRARIASKVSYRLRILRAHGLIRKSPGQRRYHVTTKGRHIITALCRSQHITLQQLNATAA